MRGVIASLAFLCSACALQPARVPLFGDPTALVGEWGGQYVSDETGRSGTIVFRLTAGQDTARGDVVMLVPRSPQDAPAFVPVGGVYHAPAQDARVLTIRFVQVLDGRIRGRLDPYTDPACSCTVQTTFDGTLKGDVISGTFLSLAPDRGTTTRGQWHVSRR